MKLTAALTLVSLLTFSAAQAEVIDLATTSGRSYRQCRILKVEADGVSYRSPNGAGKILFKDMTTALRQHFGYDEAKADALEAKVRSDRAKAKAEAMQKANEEAKAHFAAMERYQEAQAMHALRQTLAQLGSRGQQVEQWLPVNGTAVLFPAYSASPYVNDQPSWSGAWSNTLGRCMVSGAPMFAVPAMGSSVTPYRGAPFFRVPGVGPNVAPAASCQPVGVGRSVIGR